MKKPSQTLQALALGGLAFVLATSPALARGSLFPDVPEGHWAKQAVRDVAFDHRLLPVYPDGTFRGEAILTRSELARTMAAFVREIEVRFGRSVADVATGFFSFTDIDDPDERAAIEGVCSQYNLFEGIPGIDGSHFEPNRPVTRFEFAAVMDRLMVLLDKQQVIYLAYRHRLVNPYADVSPMDWAFQAVLSTSQRYQIISGFPDGTFKGNREMNRYEFSSAAANAFALIRDQVTGEVRIPLAKEVQASIQREEKPKVVAGQVAAKGDIAGELGFGAAVSPALASGPLVGKVSWHSAGWLPGDNWEGLLILNLADTTVPTKPSTTAPTATNGAFKPTVDPGLLVHFGLGNWSYSVPGLKPASLVVHGETWLLSLEGGFGSRIQAGFAPAIGGGFSFGYATGLGTYAVYADAKAGADIGWRSTSNLFYLGYTEASGGLLADFGPMALRLHGDFLPVNLHASTLPGDLGLNSVMFGGDLQLRF